MKLFYVHGLAKYFHGIPLISELSAAKDILIQMENACAEIFGKTTLVRDCNGMGS